MANLNFRFPEIWLAACRLMDAPAFLSRHSTKHPALEAQSR